MRQEKCLSCLWTNDRIPECLYFLFLFSNTQGTSVYSCRKIFPAEKSFLQYLKNSLVRSPIWQSFSSPPPCPAWAKGGVGQPAWFLLGDGRSRLSALHPMKQRQGETCPWSQSKISEWNCPTQTGTTQDVFFPKVPKFYSSTYSLGELFVLNIFVC